MEALASFSCASLYAIFHAQNCVTHINAFLLSLMTSVQLQCWLLKQCYAHLIPASSVVIVAREHGCWRLRVRTATDGVLHRAATAGSEQLSALCVTAIRYVCKMCRDARLCRKHAHDVADGERLGRHLQPAARDHFSLRGSIPLAHERYGWWSDGLRRVACKAVFAVDSIVVLHLFLACIHHLSHTTLPHTLFHTQLCHTPSFTHNFVTHHSHTTLSHTTLHIQLFKLLDPPPPPLSFLPRPASTFVAHYWKKLTCGVIRSFN